MLRKLTMTDPAMTVLIAMVSDVAVAARVLAANPDTTDGDALLPGSQSTTDIPITPTIKTQRVESPKDAKATGVPGHGNDDPGALVDILPNVANVKTTTPAVPIKGMRNVGHSGPRAK